jgi:hypothetical protein
MSDGRFVRAIPAIACLCILAKALAASAAPCVELNFGQDVTIGGTLIMRTYAGPPNYQSIQRGDSPERVRILRLDKSVCLYPLANDRDNEIKLNVDEVQLIFLEPNFPRELPIDSLQPIFVTGQFFSAQSGHQHTPALLEVFSICPHQTMGPGSQCNGRPTAAGCR